MAGAGGKILSGAAGERKVPPTQAVLYNGQSASSHSISGQYVFNIDILMLYYETRQYLGSTR
ncbi:MAG: hypothetical protein ACRD5H_13335, partial [Nitrososphaerales archaeon]